MQPKYYCLISREGTKGELPQQEKDLAVGQAFLDIYTVTVTSLFFTSGLCSNVSFPPQFQVTSMQPVPFQIKSFDLCLFLPLEAEALCCIHRALGKKGSAQLSIRTHTPKVAPHLHWASQPHHPGKSDFHPQKKVSKCKQGTIQSLQRKREVVLVSRKTDIHLITLRLHANLSTH